MTKNSVSKIEPGFRGNLYFLSNFYPAPAWYDGIKYPTGEHAFQAAKTLDPSDRERILKEPAPGKAKYIGRSVQLRDGWEDGIALLAMTEVIATKFGDSKMQTLLLDTGDMILTETNHWHDNRWGSCNCNNTDGEHEECSAPGRNWLGIILMSQRAAFREA